MTFPPRALLVVSASLVLLAAWRVPRQAAAVTVQELGQNDAGGAVSVLHGSGGNLAISSGPDGVLVVDSQFARMAPAIREELGKLGAEDPAVLVNTHFHSDHVGGNAELGRAARIVAHEAVRRRMVRGDGPGGQPGEPSAPEALPRVTFAGELTLWFNGEEIRIVHLPACHTDGDALVWFTGSNVVHLGDTFFNGRFPFVDVPSGGTVSGVVEVLGDWLQRLPDGVRVIPGHGPAGGKAELASYLDMLRESSARVRAALADGRTLRDMQDVRLLDDFAAWGDGNGFLPLLVQSAAAERERAVRAEGRPQGG